MRVTLKVILDVVPTRREERIARVLYLPTFVVPEPDAEWIAEEVAFQRLDHVAGLVDVTVVGEEDA